MKLILVLTMLSNIVMASSLKIATLVPKGTNWADTLTQMNKEIKSETNGEVKLKIYYGGTQGDEPDVLRKIRIGQLHGGIFTGKILGDIYPDIRSIEIPFNFYHDEEKALGAIAKQTDYFNQKISEKGFVNLGFYGIGKVYVVSRKKVTSIDEMKGIKMWSWEGDHLSEAMMQSLGLVSVPLALTDVTSSLSTGMIDAAYAPPLAIIGLQWHSKVKYIIDFPTAYSVGALLISKKDWSKISAANQEKIKTIAKRNIEKANELAKIDNKNSLDVLKKSGVEFISFNKSDIEKAETIRADVIKKLKGKLLSVEIIKEIEKLR